MSQDVLGDALHTVCGPLGDLNQKLAGPDGTRWLTGLKRFLRKENPWEIVVEDLLPWITVELGTHKNSTLLREGLPKDIRVDDWAQDLIANMPVSPNRTLLDIVLVPHAKVFEDLSSYKDVHKRALEFGLLLCPAEVALQMLRTRALREKLKKRHGSIYIAMESLGGKSGHGPYFFEVSRDALRGVYDDHRPWFMGSIQEWAFVLPSLNKISH